jgi:hypothetical protein
MGLLKLSNAATGTRLVNCDNVMSVVGAVNSGSGATEVLTIDIEYATPISENTDGTYDCLLKTAITYAAPGTSNENVLSAAQLQTAWEDAIAKMYGATGNFVEGPQLGVKVTASGAALAAGVPTIAIKKGSALS